MSDTAAALRAVPARHAQPDPSTLATLPKGGAQLVYMGHAEVTLALIDVDPAWNWHPVAIDPETGGPKITPQGKRLVLWGYLEVLGVQRLCVGTCDAGKGDPEKELIGDLLRNGAMRFGIGTKLWSKAVDADPAGSGRSGGYEPRRSAPAAPQPSSSAVALFDRVKATKGTPLADVLRGLADENNRKLTVADLDADPAWAELVTAVVNGEVIGDVNG
jgi:hypothetical protein